MTTIQFAPERFNSPDAIYQDVLVKDGDKSVARWYDALSSSYDQLYDREQSLKHSLVLGLFGKSRFDMLIDIGCGTAVFLQRAQQNYVYALGVDVSRKMLERARNRRLRNVDLVQAASSFLPIKGETVDCTVSISTSKADENFPRMMADVGRVSRGRSTLAITFFQEPGSRPIGLDESGSITSISQRESLYFADRDLSQSRRNANMLIG